jgi:hypothetical protein
MKTVTMLQMPYKLEKGGGRAQQDHEVLLPLISKARNHICHNGTVTISCWDSQCMPSTWHLSPASKESLNERERVKNRWAMVYGFGVLRRMNLVASKVLLLVSHFFSNT